MFDHSIKVPRLYKSASKIAKQVSESKGSIKQLVYEGKHPNIKALYALIVQTFQKTNELENILKKSKLFEKEPRFDQWLAKILITELLWGKKRLGSESKPIKTILAYEQIFRAHLSDEANYPAELEQVDKPRYVRINTLKVSVKDAIDNFRDEGWILKQTQGLNYEAYLEAVATLSLQEFLVDVHIPNLLVFPPKTQFYRHEAYINGSIILQDKASCLPVYILNPEPGSTILDMCAAPGMKTTHLAASIEDHGTIYAVELNQKRFQVLEKIISSTGATCIKPINRDVLTLSNDECPNVDYIIVDPSCSGSGLTDRVEIGQQQCDQDRERLDKLAGFQIKILRHALTRFPKVKKVIYSTCSLFPEENEDVVRQVIEGNPNFKLVAAGPFINNQWLNYGSNEFGEIGPRCLYAKPDIDLSSGFFVAVFERLQDGEINEFLCCNFYQNLVKKVRLKTSTEKRKDRRDRQKQKRESEVAQSNFILLHTNNEEENEEEEIKVKSELEEVEKKCKNKVKEEIFEVKVDKKSEKKKKKKKDILVEIEELEAKKEKSESFQQDEEIKKKKKKKKKHEKEKISETSTIKELDSFDTIIDSLEKKKKKKSKLTINSETAESSDKKKKKLKKQQTEETDETEQPRKKKKKNRET